MKPIIILSPAIQNENTNKTQTVNWGKQHLSLTHTHTHTHTVNWLYGLMMEILKGGGVTEAWRRFSVKFFTSGQTEQIFVGWRASSCETLIWFYRSWLFFTINTNLQRLLKRTRVFSTLVRVLTEMDARRLHTGKTHLHLVHGSESAAHSCSQIRS